MRVEARAAVLFAPVGEVNRCRDRGSASRVSESAVGSRGHRTERTTERGAGAGRLGGSRGGLGLALHGDGQNRISLQFPNGSRIVGLPANEATVRGFSAVSLMIVDEAARVPDDLYEAVKPMLATTDGALWLMSTPYGRRGFFYKEWTHGGDDWLRVEAPATECSRIPARFLEEEREKKGERLFAQEYMCQFLQSEDCLFRQEDLDACASEDLEPIF